MHTSERADRAARRHRNDPTFAEKTFWKTLRGADAHFPRQAPMGPYIVDFVCHSARLVVELDGGIHDLDVVAQRDAERQAWLETRGYCVLRITNAEALIYPTVVVERIMALASARTPTPNPSPQGGGEQE